MELYSPEAPPSDKQDVFIHLNKITQEELQANATKLGITLQEFLDKESAADYEDVIESILHRLPHELIDRKMAEYTTKNYSLLEAMRDSLEVIRKRSSMWKYEGNELYNEETIKTIQNFEGARYQLELFEGKGNAAYVCQVPNVPGVCIKFLHNPSMQRFSPEREFGVLKNVNDISNNFKALKVPQAHAVAVNLEASKSFFTMETIDGMTLHDLLEAPGERMKFFERVGLSASYVISTLQDPVLLEKLKDDLHLIHQNGILHGDIHPRNIMIDKDGNFYLIDFGNAIVLANLPAGEDYDTTENRKDTDLNTFVNCFTLTAKLLQEQVARQESEGV